MENLMENSLTLFFRYSHLSIFEDFNKWIWVLSFFQQILCLKLRSCQTYSCWGGAKSPPPPTSFSPVTSTNIGFGSQNFLTFSCNRFATLVENVKFVPSTSPKLLNFNQHHSSKKAIFLVKSLQN